jgi:hypothetical protein
VPARTQTIQSCYLFSEDKHLTDNQIEKLTDSIKQAFIPIDPIVKKDLKTNTDFVYVNPLQT